MLKKKILDIINQLIPEDDWINVTTYRCVTGRGWELNEINKFVSDKTNFAEMRGYFYKYNKKTENLMLLVNRIIFANPNETQKRYVWDYMLIPIQIIKEIKTEKIKEE